MEPQILLTICQETLYLPAPGSYDELQLILVIFATMQVQKPPSNLAWLQNFLFLVIKLNVARLLR